MWTGRSDPIRTVWPILNVLLTLGLSAAVGRGAPLPFRDDFSDGMGAWEPLAEGHFRVVEEAGRPVLELTRTGPQRPPVRRPGMYILAPLPPQRDVAITVRARSLRPNTVRGRDVVILFGFQDDTRYYYAHISNDSDNRTHHVIMKVDGATRTPIQRERDPEPRLIGEWHRIRVEHRRDGEIRVYVDDMDTPTLTARDEAWPEGRIGLGSFDDPARFADFAVEPLAP